MSGMDRQQILDALTRKVESAGGVLLAPVKVLAEEFGEKPERLYYAIRTLQEKGQLRAVSRGPKGMEIRLGDGVATEAAVGRRRAGRARRTAPRSAAAATSRYCPFCGKPAEANWRYCASCGEMLPTAVR